MNKVTRLHVKSRWFYNHKMLFLAKLVQRLIRKKYQCVIPCTALIDKTTNFAHNGLGVIINSSTMIESGVTIYQNVTIGNINSSKGPHIGKNVLIGAGAIIIGPIRVGDNSKIGAGAIVCDDIPPNSVVVCEKAKIIRGNDNAKENI